MQKRHPARDGAVLLGGIEHAFPKDFQTIPPGKSRLRGLANDNVRQQAITFSALTYAGRGKPAGKIYSIDASGVLQKQTHGARNHYLTHSKTMTLFDLQLFIALAEPDTYLTAGVADYPAALSLAKNAFGQAKAAGETHRDGMPIIPMGDKSTRFHPGPSLMVIDTDGFDEGEAPVIDQLAAVIPSIGQYQRLEASSSSSNIFDVAKGACLKGESGQHSYFGVTEGTDIPRALTVLHKRLWLAGYGKPRVSAAGSFLERSIVDRQLSVPSQPIFLHPHLDAGLQQDKRIEYSDGKPLLDTKALIPDLSLEEHCSYDDIVAAAKLALVDDIALAKAQHIETRVERAYKANAAISRDTHRASIVQTLKTRDLVPADTITLSNGRIVTVREILAEPALYHLRTCRDPQEPEYGSPTVAKIYSNQSQPCIRSFAHCLPGDDRIFRLRGEIR
jgi:hypothetical protein